MFTKMIIFKVQLQRFGPTASTLNAMAGTCKGSAFSILPVLSRLCKLKSMACLLVMCILLLIYQDDQT